MSQPDSPSVSPTPETLPCPWCGNRPTIDPPCDDEDMWEVMCFASGCTACPSLDGTTREQAIAAWNRRAPSPTVEPTPR